MNGQSTGHNYQIAEFGTGRSANSEVATNGQHAFTILNGSSYLFHANMYLHLDIPQYGSESSRARQHRAEELGKPNDVEQCLHNLGDESNASYPIYKTGQFNDYTLHTVSVDLPNAKSYFTRIIPGIITLSISVKLYCV